MTKAFRTAWAVCPFWSTNITGFAALGTTPAGVTFQTATPHPHAGTAGERYIKFDGSVGHQWTGPITWSGTLFNDANIGVFPDGPHRWATVFSFYNRQSATNPTGTDMLWKVDSGVGSFQVNRLIGSATGELFVDAVSQGTFTFPTGSNYCLEMWIVRCDQLGMKLTGNVQQFCLRSIDLTTFAHTILVDVDVVRTNIGPGPAQSWIMGDTVAHGAGFEFYVGTPSARWECADAPCGLIRADHQWPNSRAAVFLDEFATHAETNVDDTGGNVEPDDFTTVDQGSVGSTPGTPKSQYYDLTNPQYIAANDQLLGVAFHYRCQSNADVKGAVTTMSDALSDGATAQINTANGMGMSNTVFSGQTRLYRLNPLTGLPFTLADLQGIEMGTSWTYTGSSKTVHVTALTAVPVYVKAGEETPPIPRPRPPKIRMMKSMLDTMPSPV